MSRNNVGGPRTNTVLITAIIAVGIIILACIAAFAGISIAFLINAPW